MLFRVAAETQAEACVDDNRKKVLSPELRKAHVWGLNGRWTLRMP